MTSPAQSSRRQPYRREALEHYENRKQETRLLRIAPTWTEHASSFILWVFGAFVAFLCTARISERGAGTAALRLHDRNALTSPVEGRVVAVHAEPGAVVAQGAMLVELEATEERAQLERIEEQRFSATARFLSDPSDLEAKQQIPVLAAQAAEARARVEAKAIRAPRAGRVHDMRVRVGQGIAVGSELATIATEGSGATVTAALPARFRPRLAPGQTLRLSFPGIAHAHRDVLVEAVSDESLGPSEARRVFGPELADALPLDAPVVLVRGSVDTLWVEGGDERFRIHDGMLAEATVTMNRERIIFVLLPGLRRMLRGFE